MMRQSQLFTKTKKNAPKDEVSANAKLLIRAGFVDKTMAGVYSFLPLGLKTLKKIENIIREEMNAIGGQEILMPSLQPKENWQKTGRWDKMDDLYKVKDSSGRESALGPTHEEIVVPLVKQFINSYKDSPLYVYQIQNKFRMELRAKSGLLRGREFLMKDLYSFHLTEEDFENYYELTKKAYFKIFDRCGLKKQTYLTFASGGTFSKYSHEFQTITLAGEDTIYVCNKCAMAINKEIKDETKQCPNCRQTKFHQEKAIEVGNIFPLKTKFSKPFDLKVKDEKGNLREIIMGCYGIGLSRLMGAIIEVHHDKDGIIWPEEVAPFQIHLIKLTTDNSRPTTFADKIYNNLQKAGVDVLYDDREISAGEKFADADLIGIPYRLVVSEKTGDKIEVKKRGERKVILVEQEKLYKIVKT